MLKFILFLVFITFIIGYYIPPAPTYAKSSCWNRFLDIRPVLPKSIIKMQPHCFYLYNTFRLRIAVTKGPINYSVYILSQDEYDRFSKNNNTLSLTARNGTFIDTSKVNIITENSNAHLADRVWYDLILPDNPHFVIKNDAEEIVEFDYFFELDMGGLWLFAIIAISFCGSLLVWCTFICILVCLPVGCVAIFEFIGILRSKD